MSVRKYVCYLGLMLLFIISCREEDLELQGIEEATPSLLGDYQGGNEYIKSVFELINKNAESNPDLVGQISTIGQPAWEEGLADTRKEHFAGSGANLEDVDEEPFIIIPLVDQEDGIVTGMMSFDRIDDHRLMLRLFSHNSFELLTKERIDWEGVSSMYLLMLISQNRVFGDSQVLVNGVEVRFADVQSGSEVYIDEYQCVDWEIYFPNDPEPSTGTNCEWVTVAVADLNVILEEDEPGLDPGDDGGGENSSQDTGTPCSQADSVVHRQEVIDYLVDLKVKTTDNREHVREVYQNAFGDFRAISYAGEPGKHETPASNGVVVLHGMHHNHFAGGSSIFSERDIVSLYKLYMAGRIGDTRKFMLGLVTSHETTYMLMINDVKLFEFYGQEHLSTKTKEDFFAYEYSTTGGYNIHEGNSVGQNESRLVAFLKEQLTGLILIKGDFETMSGWSKIKSDGVGGVKDDDCK